MGKQEMRFIRREIINGLLRDGVKHLGMLSKMTRYQERRHYGQELKAYA